MLRFGQRGSDVSEARSNGDSGSDMDEARAIPAERARREPVVFPDVQLFERQVFRDTRGSFTETWRDQPDTTAVLPRFVQDNAARSRSGVIRGLHFQNPRGQAKLVTVLVGEVYDVVVDVRVGSPTFGRWNSYSLSESNGRQLYVPAGYAHGYQTVSDISVVLYKCSDFYSPDDEHTVRWDDDALGVAWPIREALLSPRDASAPLLRDMHPERFPRVD